MGERPDANTGPGVGRAGLGHELDELGVEGVELPDDEGEALLEVIGMLDRHALTVHTFGDECNTCSVTSHR